MTSAYSGWRSARLGDVCQIVSGATPKTGVASYWGGSVRWVTPNDMSKDRAQVLNRGERTLTQDGLASCGARLFPAGSVIVSSRAPVGYVAIAGSDMCTNQGCKTAVPPDYIDSKYLYWYLTYMRPDLEARASGTTFKEISKTRFAETALIWPAIDEQRRIVDLLEDHLSRLDAAEQSIRRSLARLVSLRDAALSQAVEVACASSDVKVKAIGDLAKVSSGLTPLKGNRAFYEGGTIPWITSGDLHQGLITEAKHFVTQAALDATTLKLVPAGAILIAMYGEGKTRGTAAELGIDATTNQACAAVVLHESNLRPWVRLILDANYSRLRRLAAGGVQPNLNQAMVKAIEIPIPGPGVRIDLLAQLAEFDAARVRLQSQLATARLRGVRLRRALLAAAFSGRLIGNRELAGV